MDGPEAIKNQTLYYIVSESSNLGKNWQQSLRILQRQVKMDAALYSPREEMEAKIVHLRQLLIEDPANAQAKRSLRCLQRTMRKWFQEEVSGEEEDSSLEEERCLPVKPPAT